MISGPYLNFDAPQAFLIDCHGVSIAILFVMKLITVIVRYLSTLTHQPAVLILRSEFQFAL